MDYSPAEGGCRFRDCSEDQEKLLTFVPMKLRAGIRIVLLFLVLVIGSFDRHLSYYFSSEITAILQTEAIPAHTDLPVKSCDYHEDITLKSMGCCIPAPAEIPVQDYRVFYLAVPRISPHTVWQPPEYSS